MKLVTQLVLCVLFSAIALTCSFRSSFFRCGPRRQGFGVPAAPLKRITSSNVRFPVVRLAENSVVDEDASEQGKASQRWSWVDDAVARLRSLVTPFERRVPPPKEHTGTMKPEVGSETERSPQSREQTDHSRIKCEKRMWRGWTKSEVKALQEQVELQEKPNPNWAKGVWQGIAEQFNRTEVSCMAKYYKSTADTRHMEGSWNGRRGKQQRRTTEDVNVEFTPEQDALIQQRVKDWGDKGWNEALFAKIAEELGGLQTSAVKKRFYVLRSLRGDPFVRLRDTKQHTKTVWNATLDARLLEAVRELGDTNRWQEVAERMNCSVTWSACRTRWKAHVGVIGSYPNTLLPWRDEEVARLGQLVSKLSGSTDGGSTDLNRTAWKKIGEELGRLPLKCAEKWRVGHFTKRGKYSPQEDALILRRVEEWGHKGAGLWRALNEELGRLDTRQRFLTLKTSQNRLLFWTSDMDAALRMARQNATADWKRGSWPIVAARLGEQGWNVTVPQCAHRYRYLTRPTQDPRRQWTPQMIDELMSLRNNGTSWKNIGSKLAMAPQECYVKWRKESDKHLKHGPFTPEEDALIRQAVEEHGTRRVHGFWSKLQVQMSRPAVLLRDRWLKFLFFKDV